jgi:hypothetical protein
MVYVIVGFFAGLAGFVLSARLNSSEAVAGIGYELTVIASVVIGGTSLFGGTGSVWGTVVGSILIGVLLNGLVLLNVSPYIQQIIIGVIIVLAVAFDQFAKSTALEAHGCSLGHVVKCTAMLADMTEWAAFNEVYISCFSGNYPARSAFGCSGLALGARIELECIAAVGR